MKKSTIFSLLFLVMATTQVSGQWFKEHTIFSESLQQEKKYYVGVPTGYNEADTTTKYPVIMFLHGASITATELVTTLETYIASPFTKLLFDRLFKVIFVIPDGYCEPYKGSFYTNSALYGNYEDYIAIDMMSEIKSNYNTYNHREKWSIMGHSMGGYGTTKIALKHPDNYIGFASLSGPINITYYNELLPMLLAEHGSAAPYNFTYEGNVTKLVYSMAGAFSPNPGATPPIFFPVATNGTIDPVVKELWEAQNPINYIDDWKGSPAMAIYLYCAKNDEYKLAPHSQAFSDKLVSLGIPNTLYIDQINYTDNHSQSLITSFPQGLNFLYNVMDTTQIRNKTFVDESYLASNYSIYPNPTQKTFFVSGDTEKLTNLSIYSISGIKVKEIDNPQMNERIDVSELKAGIYMVSFSNKFGSTSTIRLIKR